MHFQFLTTLYLENGWLQNKMTKRFAASLSTYCIRGRVLGSFRGHLVHFRFSATSYMYVTNGPGGRRVERTTKLDPTGTYLVTVEHSRSIIQCIPDFDRIIQSPAPHYLTLVATWLLGITVSCFYWAEDDQADDQGPWSS